MKFSSAKPVLTAIVLCFLLTSCLTSRKMDRFVTKHFNNELPRLDKKKNAAITVSSSVPPAITDNISTTFKKTNKVLPLLFYWRINYEHFCTLNTAIAITGFSNAVNSQVNKGLAQKLEGKELALTVEQIPISYSLVDDATIIWVLVAAFGWDKVYMKPDFKDLVVSYDLKEKGVSIKTGQLTVKSNLQSKGIRYFQSWKSATTDYLTNYSADITTMSKTFVTQLLEEL
jgi:hypothetical protein